MPTTVAGTPRRDEGRLARWPIEVGKEGWRQFEQQLGVDGDHLVRQNDQGTILDPTSDYLGRLPVKVSDVQECLDQAGQTDVQLVTAEGLALSWRRLFAQACRE